MLPLHFSFFCFKNNVAFFSPEAPYMCVFYLFHFFFFALPFYVHTLHPHMKRFEMWAPVNNQVPPTLFLSSLLWNNKLQPCHWLHVKHCVLSGLHCLLTARLWLHCLRTWSFQLVYYSNPLITSSSAGLSKHTGPAAPLARVWSWALPGCCALL